MLLPFPLKQCIFARAELRISIPPYFNAAQLISLLLFSPDHPQFQARSCVTRHCTALSEWFEGSSGAKALTVSAQSGQCASTVQWHSRERKNSTAELVLAWARIHKHILAYNIKFKYLIFLFIFSQWATNLCVPVCVSCLIQVNQYHTSHCYVYFRWRLMCYCHFAHLTSEEIFQLSFRLEQASILTA